MAQAKMDENRITVMTGVSSADGVTPVSVVIDSVNGKVLFTQAASGAHGAVTNREIAFRDGNRNPVMIGTSSADDGVLVIPVIEGNNLRIKND